MRLYWTPPIGLISLFVGAGSSISAMVILGTLVVVVVFGWSVYRKRGKK